MSTVRIEADMLLRGEVLIDGVPVRDVESVKVELARDCFNTVTLVLNPRRVEIAGEFEVERSPSTLTPPSPDEE